MANEITLKELQDASVDAKSLEEVVNGNETKQVTTRLGESYPSVKKAIKTLFGNGGLPATPFETKEQMQTDGVSLPDGKYAMVTEDTVNNGLYVKTAGAWVKSAYDPVALAKTDANMDTIKKIDHLNLVDSENLISGNISISGSYISTDGTVLTVSSRSVTENIPVSEGDIIKYDAYLVSGMSNIAAYNSGGTFVKPLLTSTTTAQMAGFIEIPSGVTSIRISYVTAQTNSILLLFSVGVTDALLRYGLVGNVDLFINNPLTIGGYIGSDGVFVSKGTWSNTELIAVKAGDTINYTTYLSALTSTIAGYDSNGDFVKPLLVGGGDVVGSLTIPSGIAYIIISVANSKINKFSVVRALNGGNGGSSISRYQEGKWLSMGTSITDSTATPYTYQKWVKEYFGFTLYNHAGSGSRTRLSLTVRSPLLLDDRISSCDFVTIDHGTNDFKIETHLGAIGDTPTTSVLLKDPIYTANENTNGTFYGDLKGVIEYIYSINPSARVMLMTPIKRTAKAATGTDTNSLGHKLVDYRNAILEVAELYSLPVLDNFKNSGFNIKTIPAWTADGLHPTEWAQKNVLANKVIGFIESN